MTCLHENFRATVAVTRLAETEGGHITGHSASISVICADCRMPFRFIGIPAGNHYAEPRVSVDGLELRAPLEPATHERFIARASYVFPGKKQ